LIQDAREARDAALHAIGQELRANREVLPSFADDPSRPVRRQIYPRLHLSAVDAAFAEGSLSSVRDADLLGDLHGGGTRSSGSTRSWPWPPIPATDHIVEAEQHVEVLGDFRDDERRMRDSNPRGLAPNPLSKSALAGSGALADVLQAWLEGR
jgi:hypothetical protein